MLSGRLTALGFHSQWLALGQLDSSLISGVEIHKLEGGRLETYVASITTPEQVSSPDL